MALIQNEETVSLVLKGRLDQEGSNWLRQQIKTLVGQSQIWILDMAQVEFIDSAGLVGLVEALQVATAAQAKLVLCGLNPKVRLILDITQLDRVFPIVDSLEAAHNLSAARIPALAA